jgi:hypothetical protein
MQIEGKMPNSRGQHGIPDIQNEELEEDKGGAGKLVLKLAQILNVLIRGDKKKLVLM